MNFTGMFTSLFILEFDIFFFSQKSAHTDLLIFSIEERSERLSFKEAPFFYNQAFRECKRLYNISFPESLTELGEDVFMFCDGMKYVTISPDMETELCKQLLDEVKDHCKDTVKVYTITEELQADVREIIEASGLTLCDLKLLQDEVILKKGEIFEQPRSHRIVLPSTVLQRAAPSGAR